MKYSTLYELKSKKAIDSSVIDIEAFIAEMMENGATLESISEMLMYDLETNGPMFGKFFRSIGVAGNSAITVAKNQGSLVSSAITGDQALAALVADAELDGSPLSQLLEQGDPYAMEAVEDDLEDQELIWICMLRNTCAECLPRHGVSMTRREWRSQGSMPGDVHPHCMCEFELAGVVQRKPGELEDELKDPLMRNIKPGQVKGGKRTIRAIASTDLGKAREAVARASQTQEGRKVLERLGRAKQNQ